MAKQSAVAHLGGAYCTDLLTERAMPTHTARYKPERVGAHANYS